MGNGQTQAADFNVNNHALQDKLEYAIAQLEQARPFNKARYQGAVLEISARLLTQAGGIQTLYDYAPRMDMAGVFTDTDWANPVALLPGLVRNTLEQGEKTTVVIEMLSQLRFLAISNGLYMYPGVSPEQARHFLTQTMALNLNYLFGMSDESTRVRLDRLGPAVNELFRFLLENVGFEDILGSLMEEIWRILSQRPIQVAHVKSMITQIAVALLQDGAALGDSGLGADRLVSALFGPTQGCQDDPGLAVYEERLGSMDQAAIQQETYGFARAMRDVGLVSDYHAFFLRWLLANGYTQLIPDALGLSSTGLDALRSYHELVHRLIEETVHPETAQCVYGLAMMLERGILYSSAIAPALWRQIGLQLSPSNATALEQRFGSTLEPRIHLLAGTIQVLGQPLGIGQGNNPTCQSARAISMWSYNEPDYLLHLVAQAARFDGILMHFEGQPIATTQLGGNLSWTAPLDTDSVSVLLVPHLDYVYNEMGRLCAVRGEDPHRWINPEFHGWWVGREFFLAVDVATGLLKDYDHFVEQFYRSYHPLYNGNQPIIHPQPAGLAITDSTAQFVGWHAITLIRVAMDQEGVVRVYFFNPNNDSGQNWGNDVIVSTQGYGERFGEASLPFPQMASRLYIFHDDPIEPSGTIAIDANELEEVKAMAKNSWAAERVTDPVPIFD